MNVVELIEALIPYGDLAEIHLTVLVNGQQYHYTRFDVQSDGDSGVAFVAHEKEALND